MHKEHVSFPAPDPPKSPQPFRKLVRRARFFLCCRCEQSLDLPTKSRLLLYQIEDKVRTADNHTDGSSGEPAARVKSAPQIEIDYYSKIFSRSI